MSSICMLVQVTLFVDNNLCVILYIIVYKYTHVLNIYKLNIIWGILPHKTPKVIEFNFKINYILKLLYYYIFIFVSYFYEFCMLLLQQFTVQSTGKYTNVNFKFK